MPEKQVKQLYHGELRSRGPVRVTIGALRESAKHKGTYYVVLQMDGRERYYTPENQSCGDFMVKNAGRTCHIVAEGGGKGTEHTATITLVAEPLAGQADPTPPQAAKPAAFVPPQAAQPQVEAAPGAFVPPQQPPTPPGQHLPVHGATVGMCMKEACNLIAQSSGTSPFLPKFYEEVHFITSNLIRVALLLEAGKMAPNAKKVADQGNGGAQ